MSLSEHEIQQLMTKYKTPEGLYDYKTFCEQVDKVFFSEAEAADALDKHLSKPVFIN
jgi:hypothetical protein